MSIENQISLELLAIIERIKEVLYLRTDAQVAKTIGILPGNLAERKTRNSIPFEKLVYFSAKHNIAMDWVLTGRGEPHPQEASSERISESGVSYGRETSEKQLPSRASEFIYLPKDDIEASAGKIRLTCSDQIVDHLALKKKWLENTLGVDPQKLLLITATGDAMEPTIHGGDLLLLDCSVAKVMEDGIYGVIVNQSLLVKRIQRLIDGSLVIMNDNPVYAEQKLSETKTKELTVIGRLLWMGTSV